MFSVKRTFILAALLTLAGGLSPFVANAQSRSQQALSTVSTTSKNGKEEPNPWSFALDLEAVQGLVQFNDDYISANRAQIGYDLNSWSNLSASVDYSAILYKNNGELLDNYDAHPERYGVGDANIYFNIPSFAGSPTGSFSFSTALVLPTSRVSQLASLQSEVDFNADYSYRALPWLTLIPSLGAYVRQYRYDTTDADGFATNSPFSGSYGLTSVTRLASWLRLVTGYSQVQRLDYEHTWRMIQNFEAMFTGPLAPHVSVKAGYVWRDYYVTNESAFAPVRSYALAGMTVSF